MSPRLKQVISALHRPQAQRRVFALSRAEAESLRFIEGVAVISVTGPEQADAELAAFNAILRLSFADVDHLANKISTRARSKLAHAFTARQARQILDFVSSLPSQVTDVVVHCEGGYSRSCAIAKFLHEQYAYDVEPQRLHHANQSVLEVLHRTARGESTRR